MAVEIGTVQTFSDVKPDKAQALKVLEEAAEVFGAWQACDELDDCEGRVIDCDDRVLDECADVIQATCNLIAAYGISDFTRYVERCRRRNEERGRM